MCPELEFGRDKPELQRVVNCCYYLLGQWPAALPEARRAAAARGGMVTIDPRDALHLIANEATPTRVPNPRDCVFLPEGTRHQYRNYSDRLVTLAFAVSRRNR